jgi:hypothetical protein
MEVHNTSKDGFSPYVAWDLRMPWAGTTTGGRMFFSWENTTVVDSTRGTRGTRGSKTSNAGAGAGAGVASEEYAIDAAVTASFADCGPWPWEAGSVCGDVPTMTTTSSGGGGDHHDHHAAGAASSQDRQKQRLQGSAVWFGVKQRGVTGISWDPRLGIGSHLASDPGPAAGSGGLPGWAWVLILALPACGCIILLFQIMRRAMTQRDAMHEQTVRAAKHIQGGDGRSSRKVSCHGGDDELGRREALLARLTNET